MLLLRSDRGFYTPRCVTPASLASPVTLKKRAATLASAISAGAKQDDSCHVNRSECGGDKVKRRRQKARFLRAQPASNAISRNPARLTSSPLASLWVSSFRLRIIRSSLKSYGKVSVHSVNSWRIFGVIFLTRF